MSDDDLRRQLRQLLPIDPEDGTIVVGFSREKGWPRWGSPSGLLDALVALIAEAEARGYQRAIDALRAEAFRLLQESPTETAVYEHARNFLVEASAQTAIRSGESTDE